MTCYICGMNTLPCGHPVQCLIDGDDEQFCAWCDEVVSLRDSIAALTAQLRSRAIIVSGGTLSLDGTVGYLSIENGIVEFGPRTVTTLLP